MWSGYNRLDNLIRDFSREEESTRDPKHPRRFTEEFKRQIVDLYRCGKPLKEIEEEYDLGHSTVCRWIKLVGESGSTRAADNRTPKSRSSSIFAARTGGSRWRSTF